ncbi:MAG: HAD family hydrolase [Anaerolineae bacterium]|nr:HAD family hydrolase [Anaerolineae bacterium]
MTPNQEIIRPLVELKPECDFFVGIDSDGCAFDTMEVKHKECFIPNIVKFWGLAAVSKYARDAAEFVNLYSKWRGVNRWPALTMSLDLLEEWDEVKRRGVHLPAMPNVRAFVAQKEVPLSNEGLKTFMEIHPDAADLLIAWEWTNAVNAAVAEMVHDVPPFPYLRESLHKLKGQADMMVVSATPVEALTREWEEHAIDSFVRVIAGQEMGSKAEHLRLAAKGKYADDHILMIGDAPGDMRAAHANGALFYPINPGHEEQSWQRFYQEAADRFLAGTYKGAYEAALIAEFEQYLPETPPWKN